MRFRYRLLIYLGVLITMIGAFLKPDSRETPVIFGGYGPCPECERLHRAWATER